MKEFFIGLILVSCLNMNNDNGPMTRYHLFDGQITQRLENARFTEKTPDFTDLYMIHTQDRGRKITIYCSASHCYKRMAPFYPA